MDKEKYTPVEGLTGIRDSDRRIRVFKDGVEIDPDDQGLVILEGSPESLEELRKFLSSREIWSGSMRGVAMVKW